MNRKKPIVFDPEHPIAHYERANKLKTKIDGMLDKCKLIPIAAFLIGAVCAVLNPAMIAANFFFGLLFAVSSYSGCWLKRPLLNLVSIPLGLGAAVASARSGSELAPLGAAVFFIATALQVLAIIYEYDYYMLKNLPGFPFFDVTMDDISFAAKDRFGSDEYIDESSLHESKPEMKITLRTPSNEMKHIAPPVVPELTAKEIRKMQGDKVWTYEHHRESDLSDVDLFKE